MSAQLKAEVRKLLSVRSTFLVSLAVFGLTILLMFAMTTKVYEESPEFSEQSSSSQQRRPDSAQPAVQSKNQPEPKLTNQLPDTQLMTNFYNVVPVMTLLITIVAILLMAHEYRYNTIMHTLTLSNSRSKVLVGKITVGVLYALIMSVVVVVATVIGTHLAASVKDLVLPAQSADWGSVIPKIMLYTAGYSMLGLAIITLLRNLVVSIVAIFILPTIEAIAGAILSSHNVTTAGLLPFTALNRIIDIQGVNSNVPGAQTVSTSRAALVFAIYLAVTWAAAWYLFLRRDAN